MKLKKLEQLKDATIHAPLHFEYGGVEFKFTAHIKLVPDTDIEKLTDPHSTTDKAIVGQLLVGWDDFVDDGNSIPFSKDVLDEMLGFGGITGRLSTECINAQYRVQEKN
ncbi:hypothetical protein [Pseudoalteromonas luteoviolacea]|uniref:hypothetical protein n=1 Tax=Pseudoalteromonas luteoviolacea TaxID=43657 RepID=UPI001B391FF5|nr:hypothetical protein [Pseudoalteromonas luteoviolacea]MBQ4840055.1 hypothetical protein [Pseudoalteromonas luteoviolacea]